MNRRQFIGRVFFNLLLAGGVIPRALWAGHAASERARRPIQFVFAQLRYRGGDWNPHPFAVSPLMEELMLRTSVERPWPGTK